MVNKPSWIIPHKVLQSWLINTVPHLSVKNKLLGEVIVEGANSKGGGGGGGGFFDFLPWKGGAY